MKVSSFDFFGRIRSLKWNLIEFLFDWSSSIVDSENNPKKYEVLEMKKISVFQTNFFSSVSVLFQKKLKRTKFLGKNESWIYFVFPSNSTLTLNVLNDLK